MAGSKRRRKRNTAVRLAEPRSAGTVALSYTQSPQHYQQASSLATLNQPNLNTRGEHPYPDMPRIADPASGKEPTFDQYGATGVTIFSGILDQTSVGEYNTDFGWQQGIQIFDMMRRNDAMVKAIELQIKNPIMRASWRIKPGSKASRDQEIASFIESCLFHDMSWQTLSGRTMRQSWPEILGHILTMLPYGFSLMEVCWKKEDGWIKWARWTPLMARTVYKWWPDEHNDLVGVQFYTWRDMQKKFIDIPMDKLLYFVHDQEGNNPEGQSVFRAAYKHWWYLDRFYAIEAVAIERTAVAPPVVTLPNNPTPNEESAARNIVENIRVNEKMGVVLTDRMKLETLRGSEKQAAQVQPSINHHNYKIALAVLAQFLAMGGMEHGSNARSENELFNFLATYQAVMEYICAMINQEIRRLVDYNFDDVQAYPELTCSKLVAQDVATLAKTWQALQAGNVPLFSQSQPVHQKFFAESLGMPVAVSAPVEQQNPSAPSNPDRPDNQRATDHGNDAGKPEALSEAQLLAHTLAEVYAADAVERGMQFNNPYPRQHGGKFGFGADAGHARGTGKEHDVHGVEHGARESAARHEGAGGGRSGGGKGKASGEPKATKSRKSGVDPVVRKQHEYLDKPPIAKKVAAVEQVKQPTAQERIAAMHASAHARQQAEKLTPEHKLGEAINPVKTVDASRFNATKSQGDPATMAALREAYGDHQIGALLHAHSTENLRTIAKDAGVATKGIASNHDALASAITHHVTEGRYSANFPKSAGKAPTAARVSKTVPRAEHEALRQQYESLKAEHAVLKAEVDKARQAKDAKAKDAKANVSKSWEKLDASYASLKPIAHVPGLAFDVTKPVDAVMLRTLYGDHQLHAALSRYPLGRLQEAARAHSKDIPIRASKARQIQELITWAKTQPLMHHTPLYSEPTTLQNLEARERELARQLAEMARHLGGDS